MDVYQEIRIKLLDGDAEQVSELVRKLVKLKYPPEKILQEGLIKGIYILADKFKTEMVLVPEALVVSRALNAGLETLDPYINKNTRTKYRARAIIGTVEGDIHDIGKNLVKMMISTVGIEIIDLGVDVSKEEFVYAIKEYKPDFVMISTLLTTTLKQINKVIELIKKEGLRDNVIIFLGGFPVTKKFALNVGADYFTEDAVELRDLLNNNLEKILKQNKTKKSK